MDYPRLRAFAAVLGLFWLVALPVIFPAAPVRSFDEAWREFEEAATAGPPVGTSMKAMLAFIGERRHRLNRLALDIFESYPEGKAVRIADYRGKVLILNFWATWCGPCVASMTHTQEIAAKYAAQGLAELLRRCGMPVKPEDLPPPTGG